MGGVISSEGVIGLDLLDSESDLRIIFDCIYD